MAKKRVITCGEGACRPGRSVPAKVSECSGEETNQARSPHIRNAGGFQSVQPLPVAGYEWPSFYFFSKAEQQRAHIYIIHFFLSFLDLAFLTFFVPFCLRGSPSDSTLPMPMVRPSSRNVKRPS